MEWMFIFLILGSIFYAARIYLDFGEAAMEIQEKVEAYEVQADRAANLAESQRLEKVEIAGRVETLKQQVNELREQVATFTTALDTERQQEQRIQMALTKRKVEKARGKRQPMAMSA